MSRSLSVALAVLALAVAPHANAGHGGGGHGGGGHSGGGHSGGHSGSGHGSGHSGSSAGQGGHGHGWGHSEPHRALPVGVSRWGRCNTDRPGYSIAFRPRYLMGSGFFYGPGGGFFYDEPSDWTPLDGAGPEDEPVAVGLPTDAESLVNALAPGDTGQALRADVASGRLLLDPVSLAPAAEEPGLPGEPGEQQVLARAAAWMRANGWKPRVTSGRLVSMDGQVMVFFQGTVSSAVIRDLAHAGFVLLVVPKVQAIQNEDARAVVIFAPQEDSDQADIPPPPEGAPPALPESSPPPPEM